MNIRNVMAYVGMMVLILMIGVVTAQDKKKDDPKVTLTGEAPEKLPVPDDDDMLNITSVLAMSQTAAIDCQAMDSWKKYTQRREAVSLRLEVKYKGFVFDWNQQQLVKKQP